MLTIAIPTYNRNQTLRDNLALLLPQITEQCRLVLFDNCSDEPVEETLRDLMAQFPAINARIIRNTANIGANANIVRCIETCETPWVWVLGDDDKPKLDAIAQILGHTEAHSDCVLLNFSTDGKRPQTFFTCGLADLANKLDTSADLPWISSSVYKTAALKKHLKFGYQYLYSMLPHVVMLLLAVNEDARCCLSKAQIVNGETRETVPEQRWSLVNLTLGYPTLLELPIAAPVREKLVEKLLVTERGDGFNLRHLIYELLLMATRHNQARNALYIFDQVMTRRFYFDKRPKFRAQRFLWRQMLKFPAATKIFYRVIKRHELGGQGQKLQDRYGRL
jgi:glycosyltransferase involved in cell wall biosynthesis